jgi:glycosyltransferase involved in cell wall biosynthesis
LKELIYSSEFLSKDIMIILMGPDLMGGELQKLVKDSGYSNVRFLAPVEADQVTELIASADLGIIPVQSVTDNSYYGLGNKIFHYIAAGLPIAVSNQPERRKLVENYNIGIVFDEKDPRDIAMKIHAMLENEEEYQLTRQRVREAYISDLNWEKEAEKLINLYKLMT